MKYLLALIASLALALAGLGFLYQQQATALASLAEENSVLKEASKRAQERMAADRKVLVARQAQIAAQRVLEAQTKTALSGALQANKTWSDTDVPPEVQKALSGPSDGPDGPSGRVPNPD